MAKGLPRSLARAPAQAAIVRKQTVTVKDLPITVAGLTGVGWGTALAGALPEGNILFLGAVAYLQFSTASANMTATWDGDYSVGSAPTADATLNGSEVDLIPSTALGAATAKVSPLARGANATQVMLDNTDGSLEVNINLLVDDANIDANGVAVLANGQIILSYIVLGDD